MQIVTIYNEGIATEIHGLKQRLSAGSVVQAINEIDSFSFTILPNNAGFNRLKEFKTLVNVYNTNKKRDEFWGRVLYPCDAMEEDGSISKDVTCESFLAFLIDSQQLYVEEKNWTVDGLLQHIIDCHNSQVEDYKKFVVGEVTVTDPNNNLYEGIQRKNSWETIKEKLIDKLGGEITFRYVDGVIYLDYLVEIGETKSTTIALSKNMRAITREKNPSEYITRLIPLGCKLKKEVISYDEEGNETVEEVETEQRLDISSVNDGSIYIDDTEAIEAYGIHIQYVEFDDVTEPSILKTKGEKFLIENNKIQVKYSITALDLSLLGLDIDDFERGNRHPIENALLGINDTARIIKKNIDISDEENVSIEIGDNFKTLSDFQVEQAKKLETSTQTIEKIEKDYVTNEVLKSQVSAVHTLISQTAEAITLSVNESFVSKEADEQFKQELETQLQVLSDQIIMNFTTTNEQFVTLDGVTSSKFEEIYKYIQFKDGTLTLGSSENNITLTLENDIINFRRNGVVFGSWDGENFYTGNITVRVNERAQFGNFAYFPRSDGSLSFAKVGEA